MSVAQAQSRTDLGTPAEFPPASFKENQYVDSRGCVYIRAGIDGNVTWVPRVNRSREVLCGAAPTAVAGATAAPSAAPLPKAVQIAPPADAKPAAKPAPKVVAKPAPKPVAKPAAKPAPKPLPKRAAAPVTTRAPVKTIASTTKPPRVNQPAATAPAATYARPALIEPQGTRQQATPRKPSPAPAPTVFSNTPKTTETTTTAPSKAGQTRGGNCPNASAFSQQFINDGSKFPVRCGPQAESPVTRPGDDDLSMLESGQVMRVSGKDDRVVPRHVYVQRQNTRNVQVPQGYRPVWEDDRLNPHRAEGTLRGHQQMQGIWSDTTPRTLHDLSKPRPAVKAPKVYVPSQLGLRPEASAVSTRNTPARVAAKQQQPTAKARYVQIATFGVEANARATAQKMARTGLPVRMGTLTKGGKSYRLVLAGPFASGADANAALRTARAAGFPDAFIR